MLPRWLARIVEAAGVVLYVYFVGGLVLSIRLSAAGLPAGPDVITLVSGGHVLAVGARALLVWGLLCAAICVPVIWALVRAVIRVERRFRTWVRLKRWWTFGFVMAATVVALVGLVVPASATRSNDGRAPTNGGHWVISTVLALLMGFLVAAGRIDPPPSFAVALLVVTSVSASALALAVAADERTRLSRAVIETKDRKCVEGPLVASTDRGFYLGDGQNHSIALIPRDEVVRSIIERRKLVVADSFLLTGESPPEIPRA